MRLSLTHCCCLLSLGLVLTLASPPRHRMRHHPAMRDDAGAGGAGASGGANCTGCHRAMEDAIRLRRQQIQADILGKLGFAHAPRVAVPKLPPLGKTNELVQRLLQNNRAAFQSDDPGGRRSPVETYLDSPVRTVQKVYSLAKAPPSSFNFPSTLETAYFDFSRDTARSELRHSLLYVHVKDPVNHSVSHTLPVELKIEVYSRTRKGTLVSKPLVSKKIRHRFYGAMSHWLRVPFLGPTQNWFTAIRNEKPDNFGVLIRVTYKGENLASHPTADSPSNEESPYLELSVRDGGDGGGRSKRALPLDCDAQSAETRCCRYPMVIDFAEFQWDFVIAPKRYNAHVCYGQCPKNWLQQYPHTHLAHEQSEAAAQRLSGGGGANAVTTTTAGTGGPCCHPTEYGSIMMVYMNEQEEILVSKVPGMIATRCGCA